MGIEQEQVRSTKGLTSTRSGRSELAHGWPMQRNPPPHQVSFARFAGWLLIHRTPTACAVGCVL